MFISNRLVLLQLKKQLKLILIFLFLCCSISGCALIAEQEQFVSSPGDDSLIRDNGDCSNISFLYDVQKTGGPLPGLDPDSIAILDWNIYKGKWPNWDVDFIELSRDKDIIFLQEASLNEKLMQVLFSKDLHWNLNSAFKFKGVETGVLVASTAEPLVSCGLRYREPIIGVPKTTLISKYMIAGSTRELLVANIHGINISFGVGAYQQQFEALQNILKMHDGPIILAGDFNNWSEKRTAIVNQMAENLSLEILTFKDDGRTTFFGDPVDQVLYRGLEPSSRTVHPVTSSDHNPISVTFRLDREHDSNNLVTQ
jgi:endonuclease/exonuclease/phosphatase (EEP) superfamily protein YafD